MSGSHTGSRCSRGCCSAQTPSQAAPQAPLRPSPRGLSPPGFKFYSQICPGTFIEPREYKREKKCKSPRETSSTEIKGGAGRGGRGGERAEWGQGGRSKAHLTPRRNYPEAFTCMKSKNNTTAFVVSKVMLSSAQRALGFESLAPAGPRLLCCLPGYLPRHCHEVVAEDQRGCTTENPGSV